MNRPVLTVSQLTKHYDGKSVLSGLDFEVKSGEIFCVLGPSGCGKSTLLRTLAGLEESEGEIILDGKTLQSQDVFLPTEKRQMGIVFQDYSLFPHLNVEKNIKFGINVKKQNATLITHDLLNLVGLKGHERKYPHELSGGEQQRVAIARALAHSPKLLLFDEPFSNLDVTLRRNLRSELKSILKENGITAIFITHDQEEAFDLGDTIAILHEGRFQQIGKGSDLYNFPETLFIADFIGSGNYLQSTLTKDHCAQTILGNFKLDHEQVKALPTKCRLYIPSSAIEISSYEKEGFFEFDVINSSFRGDFFSFDLKRGEDILRGIKSKKLPNSLGRLFLKIDTNYIQKAFA